MEIRRKTPKSQPKQGQKQQNMVENRNDPQSHVRHERMGQNISWWEIGFYIAMFLAMDEDTDAENNKYHSVELDEKADDRFFDEIWF